MTAKPSYPAPSKKMICLTFGALMLWGLIVSIGIRVPYLYTEFAFQVRTFALYPLLLITLIYFGFIYHKPNQKTGYMQAMDGLSTRKERIKNTLMSGVGLVGIPAFIAWTSIAFPAVATQLFASERYTKICYIDDINHRSAAGARTLFDLEMTNIAGEKVSLLLSRSRYEQNNWRTGEKICVIGRTGIFGTIINETSRYLDRCYGQ